MTTLPMFPLGSVLFPAMPLPLRVFEDRYLAMLATVLQDEPPEFGVVLIERGQEVGGGDTRFDIGTIARIADLDVTDSAVGMLALGGARFEVLAWGDDDPYPTAEIRMLPELVWDEGLRDRLHDAERAVRTGLAIASEYVELAWSPDVEVADSPLDAAWQLAAIAPLGPLDQIELMRSESLETLLTRVVDLTAASVDSIRFSWTDLTRPEDEEGSHDGDDR
ncbi:MAG: LON peptidase substrate-binding domain-containing protein [Pseudolysinimonas sp.]